MEHVQSVDFAAWLTFFCGASVFAWVVSAPVVVLALDRAGDGRALHLLSAIPFLLLAFVSNMGQEGSLVLVDLATAWALHALLGGSWSSHDANVGCCVIWVESE